MTTSIEAAWVSAIVVSLALMGMWGVLYLGMRATRDGVCPARAQREEALRLQSEAQSLPAPPPAPVPVPVPLGRDATVGRQRKAQESAREKAPR